MLRRVPLPGTRVGTVGGIASRGGVWVPCLVPAPRAFLEESAGGVPHVGTDRVPQNRGPDASPRTGVRTRPPAPWREGDPCSQGPIAARDMPPRGSGPADLTGEHFFLLAVEARTPRAGGEGGTPPERGRRGGARVRAGSKRRERPALLYTHAEAAAQASLDPRHPQSKDKRIAGGTARAPASRC